MSTGRRAYDLLRGYVNSEWDRIRGVEDDAATQELAEGLENPTLRRPTDPTREPISEPADRMALARKILGVPEGATFAQVRTAFERINRRADPSNFPAGSPEATQASEIQRRVQWAYGVLTDGMDTTEKRFRSLEI
jgi:hypothetical protein